MLLANMGYKGWELIPLGVIPNLVAPLRTTTIGGDIMKIEYITLTKYKKGKRKG
jgi:hypothetical protein